MLRGYGGKKTKRAKAKLELNLATVGKENEHCKNALATKGRLHPLLDAEGRGVSWDEGKAELLHALFASLFNTKAQDTQSQSWNLVTE